jgi:hypothetical protein
MSSIRVTGLGTTTREDELKVYFSKPENGGGPIEKIYSPLMNNDAVIIFQESHGKQKQKQQQPDALNLRNFCGL